VVTWSRAAFRDGDSRYQRDLLRILHVPSSRALSAVADAMTQSRLPEDLAALLKELRGVRDASVAQLLVSFLPRLRHMARRHLPAQSPLRLGIDSEDLVQEGLLQLVNEVDRFRGSTWPEFLAFVHSLFAQKAAQQARRQRVRKGELGSVHEAADLVGGEATPSVNLSSSEDRKRLRRLLGELAEPYKTVMRLRLDGLDHGEIASKLGITAATARQRLSRAIKMMQERW
jgi:RNA polymerase sigma factor (sigma-70 family)